MKITTAHRLAGVGEYYFSAKLREIDELNRQGEPVINLGIGSPDLPPHPSVISVLQAECAKPDIHAYQSYRGSHMLRSAFAHWYQTAYGVTLDPNTEVLPLIGSKEGLMHICMTYLGEGDEVLVPDPGYPTYTSAVRLAGAVAVPYDLNEAGSWLPDWKALRATDLSKVKMMIANYPHMPSGAPPDDKVFAEMIAFAAEYEILLVHDNPYSHILNSNPQSILRIPGAIDVAIELNSLSKSHNMAGWRVGVVCGRADRIIEILRFKSNMDSGMFLPVQLAAAKALELGSSWFASLNREYAERRLRAEELLRLLGCSYSTDQVGMFVWARVPQHVTDGYAMSDQLLAGARVFITPGGIFGKGGERYLRVSLCNSVERIEESIQRTKDFLKRK
jgi:LL-diaminopimelate aminotransferase